MLHEQALLHLEELLNDPRYLDLIPHQKGNSIRIGKYVIRENKSGFLIYDCEINKWIYSKITMNYIASDIWLIFQLAFLKE